QAFVAGLIQGATKSGMHSLVKLYFSGPKVVGPSNQEDPTALKQIELFKLLPGTPLDTSYTADNLCSLVASYAAVKIGEKVYPLDPNQPDKEIPLFKSANNGVDAVLEYLPSKESFNTE